MCGRYANSRLDKNLQRAFQIKDVVGEQLPASWNVAPTDPGRIVLDRPRREDPDGPVVRQLRTARWGLVPSWSKDRAGAARMINARVETVTSRRAYTAAARRRRCLVPADGYYEWQRIDGRKVPHFLHRPGEDLAFAGLYELWPDPTRPADDPDRWLWTYTIVTRPAPDALGHIHDRSPVVVPVDLHDRWLDPTLTAPAGVDAVLAAAPAPQLEPVEVGNEVGNVRNDGPGLVRPVRADSRAPGHDADHPADA